MNKKALMKKLAVAIEWRWWKTRCYKSAIHILWKQKMLKGTSLIERLSHRMEESRSRAKELQCIYNVLYFNRY